MRNLTFAQQEMARVFEREQRTIVSFANHPEGRRMLGIGPEWRDNRIAKVTPWSFHPYLGGNRFAAEIRCYPVYYNMLAAGLGEWVFGRDIQREKERHYRVRPRDMRGLFHHLDPYFYRDYPRAFHASGDPIYAQAGDGHITSIGTVWADIRGATSGTAVGTNTTAYLMYTGDNVGDYSIYRGFWPFVTSVIGAGATILTAPFMIWPTLIVNGATGSVVLILTTQASTGSLVGGDFDNLTLNSPAEGATRKTLASMSTGSYNTIDMNATGKEWIDVTGNTLLGTRDRRDVDNDPPTSATVNRVIVNTSEQTDVTNDPKLVPTYTVAGGGGMMMMF